MEKLAVTIIQTSLAWENPDANITRFNQLISSAKNSKTHLVVLPEMFTTGFTMKPQLHAESPEGKGLQWMKQKAIENNCCITGSICVQENNAFYNRLYWAENNGTYQYYDKHHLFRMGDENNHYKTGNKKISTTINGWNILPLVCYDLRFPVWSRNKWQMKDGVLSADYDVLLYVANWPEVRSYPWKQLLIARAIENQCYVVGVNRIGVDGDGFNHSGDSVVINPLGQIISNTKANEESVETVLLDYEFLQALRKKFPVGLDADNFEIK